jgi:glycosyltransferase involved in cell wall biosynthesis
MSKILIVEFGGFHGKDVFLNSSGTTYLTNRLSKDVLPKFLSVVVVQEDRLLSYLKGKKFDVIHFYSYNKSINPTEYYLKIRKLIPKVKLVMDWGIYNPLEMSFNAEKSFDHIDHILNMDKVIVPNSYVKRSFDSYLNTSDFIINPYGVNKDIQSLNVNWSEGNICKLCFVGALTYRKGLDILMDVLRLLHDKVNFEFYFFGSSEGQVIDEILKHDFVKSVSVLPRKRLLRELRAMDAMIFPTRAEGMSRAVMECLSIGLPVFTTKFSGCKDMLLSDNRVTFEIDLDARTIVVEILKYLELPLADRLSLSRMIKSKLAPYSWANHWEKNRQLYAAICS